MLAIVQVCLISLLPILAIVAAMTDLTSYTIPNWISLALAAAFILAAALIRMPLAELRLHAIAGGLALAAGVGMFALGWIGGGDAKLLSVGCLWFGWPGSQAFLLDTALAGGAFAFMLLVARGQMVRPFLPAVLPVCPGWIGRLVTPGEPAPYGVAIALGALSAFPSSDWLRFVHTSY
jgi:prepilin peptidase CpaA